MCKCCNIEPGDNITIAEDTLLLYRNDENISQQGVQITIYRSDSIGYPYRLYAEYYVDDSTVAVCDIGLKYCPECGRKLD